MPSRNKQRAWKETPEHIVGMLKGLENGKESPDFLAWRDAVRVNVHKRIFKNVLGSRSMERNYERAWELFWRLPLLMQEFPTLSQSRPRVFSVAGKLIMWPDIERAVKKAQARLPKYFPRVRALLRAHVGAWLSCEKNAARLMVVHPEIRRPMEVLLRMRRPVVTWVSEGRSEITYPTSESLSGQGAEIEAVRLLLVLLTWHDDWRSITAIRECPVCQGVYLAIRSDQKVCGASCRKKLAKRSPNFKQEWKQYMRDRRESERKEKLQLAKQMLRNCPTRRKPDWKEWVTQAEPSISKKFLTMAVEKGDLKPPKLPKPNPNSNQTEARK